MKLVYLIGVVAVALCVGAGEEAPMRFVPATVELGKLSGEEVLKREVKLEAGEDAMVLRLMSSCSCITVRTTNELPLEVAAGEHLVVTMEIDPSSYAGSFNKILYAQVRAREAAASKLVRLVVRGEIEDDWGAEDEGEGAVEVQPEGAAAEAEAEPTVEATGERLVLFLSPECDRCNWVKLMWLPGFSKAHPEILVEQVDVTTDAGVRRLLELEQAAGVTEAEKGDAPAAGWRGRMYYGSPAIEKISVATRD